MSNSAFSDVNQVASLLRSTPSMLRTQLLLLNDEALSWRSAPDDWCIKEIIGHLIETDRDDHAAWRHDRASALLY